MAGPVDELVGEDDIQGTKLLLHAADGAHRDEPVHAEGPEAVDVRAEIDLGREQPVTAAMTRQEGDVAPAYRPEEEGVGRVAEGCLDPLLPHVLEAGELVETAAADDAEGNHACSPTGRVLQEGAHPSTRLSECQRAPGAPIQRRMVVSASPEQASSPAETRRSTSPRRGTTVPVPRT